MKLFIDVDDDTLISNARNISKYSRLEMRKFVYF